ncbi:oligoendopeptidase F [Paenibacillus albiflavus]|uniref:Oligopeptidase F n=1 Tax=Paenibacillus albiflavus TaxID=2545760 RepID=A0A4R4EK23_9BACL|nr:oligoendopeptidase F [Paenibacillus albiflavus]TCZ80087.1 oligoendopeptidase F [Paenibacillus albiflavus]
MEERLKRSEVPVEATWNLKDLFETKEAWEAEVQSIQASVSGITQYKGQLTLNAATLLACLNAQEELQGRLIRAYAYASLHMSGDATDSANVQLMGHMNGVYAEIAAELSFVDSEISELSEDAVAQFYALEPELEVFRNHIQDLLDSKPHKLSAETEQVLASLGGLMGSPYKIYQRSKLSDMTFDSIEDENGKKLPVSFALYENKYEQLPDTQIRRAAFQSFSNTLQKYKQTIAETYATEVKKQVIMSRLRKYDSVTDMLLESHKVTHEMYNNILDIIQKELAPHMRRLARLKKRVLGLDRMTFCDLKVPLDPEFSPSISYEEAGKLVLDSLQVLGPEYSEFMSRALTERWIDYADNVGKSTGAFCSSPYGAHSYILISWANNMRGAFTLAHELGHAGHFMLAGRYQRHANVRPSMYFIEAPSTMNEMLLAEHILKQSTDVRMKRWVIMQLLNTYYHNFVTHLLEGELQRRVYAAAMENKTITADFLSNEKGAILESFWGDEVEIDEGAKLTWMRQPHYYMGLYPYTYSAGLTASTAVSRLIIEEGAPAVERWLQVLKAGGSMNPLELMKLAGVDMSDPQPIKNAVAYVGSLVEELEALFE